MVIQFLVAVKKNEKKYIKDIANKKFGRLLVLEYSHNDKHNFLHWKCQCDCGNIVTVAGYHMRRGTTTSCGCLRKQTPTSSAKRLYRRYKSGAKKRNYEFLLTLEEFLSITEKNCYYCGISPSMFYVYKKRNIPAYIGNGIDRKNNTKGYFLDNCVPCCSQCNKSKLIMSDVEFIEMARQIVKIHGM